MASSFKPDFFGVFSPRPREDYHPADFPELAPWIKEFKFLPNTGIFGDSMWNLLWAISPGLDEALTLDRQYGPAWDSIVFDARLLPILRENPSLISGCLRSPSSFLEWLTKNREKLEKAVGKEIFNFARQRIMERVIALRLESYARGEDRSTEALKARGLPCIYSPVPQSEFEPLNNQSAAPWACEFDHIPDSPSARAAAWNLLSLASPHICEALTVPRSYSASWEEIKFDPALLRLSKAHPELLRVASGPPLEFLSWIEAHLDILDPPLDTEILFTVKSRLLAYSYEPIEEGGHQISLDFVPYYEIKGQRMWSHNPEDIARVGVGVAPIRWTVCGLRIKPCDRTR